MGIRYMCKEREDNLIDINVYGHGCMEGLYNCEGRFNTKHIFSDGFNPDSGWYRIADYRVNDLKVFMKKGINITYDDSCKYVSELIKTLNYMKENDIPITINTEDIVDTDGEDYYINSFSVVFPKVGGEIIPHIVIYVEEV